MKRIIAPSAVLVIVLTAILGCGTSGGSGSVTERIDADDGGIITSDDGILTLEIPAGALAEDTRITIQEVDAGDMPDEFVDLGVGTGYELTPEGLTFAEPVAVSLALDSASLAADSGDGYEAYALLSWSEEYGMEPLENLIIEISPSEGEATLRGELDHFSFLRRSKSGVKVSLEEVEREQPVGGFFSALLQVENISDGVNPVLTNGHGSFHAYGTVELVGSGEFSIPGSMEWNQFHWESGNFQCKNTPGIGSYGVQVQAVIELGAERTRASRHVSIVLDSVVECVAPIPQTLQPPPVTPEDFIEQMLGEMGYTPQQITQLRIARIFDPTGDWLWSILGMTPGELEDYLDFLWYWGLITETDLAALEFWFGNTLFECGEVVDGRLTVCGDTPGDFPEGDMLIFAASFNGDIPLADPDHYYVYSVVMDGDGDPSNNFEFMPPYDWDFYQGTDRWYELIWDPTLGSWDLYLVGENFADIHTDARAVIAGNAVIFFIPASEVEVERPAYRMTSFGHDGTYTLETGGGDVTGDDPTQPLTEITGDKLQAP